MVISNTLLWRLTKIDAKQKLFLSRGAYSKGTNMAKLCQKLRKKDRSCLPLVDNDYCSPYELRECFPCLTSPISYFLVERFPFVQWLSTYSPSYLISDIIAGLTVGLMVVPQALAYASIAQLPLQVFNTINFINTTTYFVNTTKNFVIVYNLCLL